ncbi:MAG: hypothetical protein KJN64_00790, partial [Ignavibacteria bacterium]|nr:hypothetical protein [Ignavibacteria bacterium]
MKKKILFVTILTLATNFALAQYFYTPYLSPGQNPSGLNTDDEFPIGGGAAPGWTTILAGGNTANTYSANRTIPFAFNFNGITESQYKVSNSGILTFDVATGLSPGTANSILPSILVPDKAICIWGIAGPGANDNIISKTFGTSPNRQHWISFSSYNLNNNWSYWSIVLEEGTDKIYIVDQRHQSIQSGLTLGIQINDTFAIQVANSPNIATVAGSNSAPSDNAYYEFTQGTQPDYDFEIHHIALNSFPNIDMAPFSIAGDLSNLGASTITSFNINYSINGGAIQTSAINSVSVPLGSNFEFSHSTNWNPTVSGMYTLKVWASNLNGNLDQNPGNDTLSKTIVISDSLPNIIDNYINSVSTNTVIGNIADGLNIPRDLDFHPDLNRFELWVINKSTEANGGST